jgi:hypothetical protein
LIQRPAGVGAVPVFMAGNKHDPYFHQYQFWEITSRGISTSVDKLEGRVSPKGIGGGYSQFSIQNLEKLGSFFDR